MISDEAVEAAANAISECAGMRFDGFWSRVEDLEPEDREYALTEARAALEAAMPFIAPGMTTEWGVRRDADSAVYSRRAAEQIIERQRKRKLNPVLIQRQVGAWELAEP